MIPPDEPTLDGQITAARRLIDDVAGAHPLKILRLGSVPENQDV